MPSCRTCGSEMVVAQIEVVGQSANYSVRLFDLPVVRCSHGHEIHEAYDEFMVKMGEQLAWGGVLFSKRSGLLRRRDVCRECGSELNERSAASQRIEVLLEHGGAPRYGLQITASVVECPDCRIPQVLDREEHHDGVSGAIRDAIEKAGIEFMGH
jgi:hypothetical protein